MSALRTQEHSENSAWDVFNGDADGICALHQLRLHNPQRNTLITGVKRDIDLLQHIPSDACGHINVFDISYDSNSVEIERLLQQGCHLLYFDHHAANKRQMHPRLESWIDESSELCSSLLVNRYLHARHGGNPAQLWALVAAFGDNLGSVAHALANNWQVSPEASSQLAELGFLLNYNAYGETVEDLHFHPEALYRALAPYQDPHQFIAESADFLALQHGYKMDAQHLENCRPAWRNRQAAAYILPNAPWAKRVSGILANQLINQDGSIAYAVLTDYGNQHYMVSVRSPQPDAQPASRFCQQFATGGGRNAAGGINRLPHAELDAFLCNFADYFSSPSIPTTLKAESL